MSSAGLPSTCALPVGSISELREHSSAEASSSHREGLRAGRRSPSVKQQQAWRASSAGMAKEARATTSSRVTDSFWQLQRLSRGVSSVDGLMEAHTDRFSPGGAELAKADDRQPLGLDFLSDASAGAGSDEWIEHRVEKPSVSGLGRHAGVPVYIMLPLDSVTLNNTLSRPRAFRASLTALKSAGTEGVMVDVWWGIVERAGPMQYEIPLPPWVTAEIEKNPDIVYTDRIGGRNYEYLSLGCDLLPVLASRTPVQVYTDFMRSFKEVFAEFLGNTITEVQVGMGPAGELRYPAYPEGNGKWRFPGIGEFQCYDKYMMISLRACAESVGKAEWGYSGPDNAGHYTQWPDETGFFHQQHGAFASDYGHFFLSGLHFFTVLIPEGLLKHIVSAAKVAGVHLSGENALPRFDESALTQIVGKSRLQLGDVCLDYPLSSFTFLRMSEQLFRPDNWVNFALFVRHMREGRTFSPWEDEHQSFHHHVRSTGQLSQHAAELMLQ
eukprot:SM000038S14343  [mRNA]  locus=s38:302075:305230:- [translate_table: standard]